MILPYEQPYYSFSPSHWEKFFQAQTGGSSLYIGLPYQRGGLNLGSVFRGLAKSIIPMIKSGAKTVGKQALRSSLGVASDLLDGQDLGSAVETRGREAASRLLKKGSRALNRSTKKKKARKNLFKGGKRLGFMGVNKKKPRVHKRDIFGV